MFSLPEQCGRKNVTPHRVFFFRQPQWERPEKDDQIFDNLELGCDTNLERKDRTKFRHDVKQHILSSTFVQK